MNELEICRLTVITGNKPIFYIHGAETIGCGRILVINESLESFEVVGIPSRILNGKEMEKLRDDMEASSKYTEANKQILATIPKKATCIVDYY